MNKSVCGRGLAIVIALLLPMVMIGLQYPATQPTVWIVFADSQDASEEIAAQIFSTEVESAGCIVKETQLSKINRIPFHADAIVLIGHGQDEGLEVSNSILPWTLVNDALEERLPKMTILLACKSPSNPDSKTFGFTGQIDAKAGALLSALKVVQTIKPNMELNIPLEHAISAQMKMKNPLESFVYFIHGYHGDNLNFEFMEDYLRPFIEAENKYGEDSMRNYSYFQDYPGWPAESVHLVYSGVSAYSENFYNRLLIDHEPGTQIDIVAHSLGGIITREMLRLHRTDLQTAGIEIGRVITLGTPHYGTEMACANPGAFAITVLMSLFGDLWFSPVFLQMHPSSDFMIDLNTDPESYMDGTTWYSISGIDPIVGFLLYYYGILDGANDGLITVSSSTVPFASDTNLINGSHFMLVKDGPVGDSYPIVNSWLEGGIDSDNDGIIDAEERHIYFTNPKNSDSDNDLLSDYDEIFIHGTNPNAWSTDGDILSDKQEIDWEYDAFDTDNPIEADQLTYSAWQINGITGYVRANHYAAMEYVEVYVKYKNSLGYWTAYFYAGTDSTPYYYGDYYVSWSLLQGYVQMHVRVEAFDSVNHYLGSDEQYVTLPGSGGGRPGGDPVPE